MREAICEICGKSYEAKNERSKYCSDRCRAKAAHERELDRLRYKQRAGKKLTIREINELALAEHISYGQYVAKYKI